MSDPRTRFAPSPTGSLHVGGARTALYCLLWARHHGGRFVLRIEDTDQVRSTESAAQGIARDLRWLGLLWDEGPEVGGPAGPYFQSERLARYDEVIAHLLASGHAYEAWETREELDALRQEAEAAERTFRYRRRPLPDAEIERFHAEGRRPVVRLVAPTHDVTVDDDILGPVTVAATDLDDIVLRKADGFPTYHFAVVVDDHDMGITQVLRGQEHLMNTHKHAGIYLAMGWDMPRWGHLPIIFNPSGSKMSKRDKAKVARAAALEHQKARGGGDDWGWLAQAAGLDAGSVAAFASRQTDDVDVATAIGAALRCPLPMIEVMDFRRAGYLPEALLNYLALLGWSPGDDRERMGWNELVAAFTLDRVNKTPARFDVEKLRWMNAETIRAASIDRLLEALERFLEVAPASPLAAAPTGVRRRLLAAYQPRLATLAELDEKAAWVFRAPAEWDEKAARKHILEGGGVDLLRRVRARVAALADWSPAAADAALLALAEEAGVKLGAVAQPLRIALVGSPTSPGVGETLTLLGRDEALRRIDRCLGRFGGG